MNKIKYVLPALILALPILVFTLVLFGEAATKKSRDLIASFEPSPTPLPTLTPVPSLDPSCVTAFQDGGGPYYIQNAPFRDNIAPPDTKIPQLIVTGTVYARDCKTPLPGVVLDIWQADNSGEYQDDWFRGQVTTDDQGKYAFKTVPPKGYQEGTAFRPPHIHFKVKRDSQVLITSQMFLPEALDDGIGEAFVIDIAESTDSAQLTLVGTHDIVVP